MGRAGFDIAQQLRRVDCSRNEHRRRHLSESIDVASATDWPASRDERLRRFAEGRAARQVPAVRGLPK